jgi:hypothetical protein
MKTTARAGGSTSELCFELKYCERCGGLWLRPVAGGQIYCVACGRQMAELPPTSQGPETARMSRGPRWGGDECNLEGLDEDDELDLDATDGVA